MDLKQHLIFLLHISIPVWCDWMHIVNKSRISGLTENLILDISNSKLRYFESDKVLGVEFQFKSK
jgi:hypothetical protein